MPPRLCRAMRNKKSRRKKSRISRNRNAKTALRAVGESGMSARRPKATPSDIDVFDTIDQAALDAIPTGLCVCTADAALIRYNRRAVELWGRGPRLRDRSEQPGANV